MAVKEIDLPEILNDYDWAEVFADESSGNTDKTTEPCPPESTVDCTPPSRTEIAEVIATVNGENDESDWVGVFLLKDGRYCVASGGCDYTGWDCRASNHIAVSLTLADAIAYGLTGDERERLGLAITDHETWLAGEN